MPAILTDALAAKVATTGGTRYSKEDWTKYLNDVAGNKDFAGKTVGSCELDFPGVKPAHVRHMFIQILKATPALSKKLTVGKSDESGICLKVAK